MTTRRQRIARAFGHARGYEAQAQVQRRIADALADRIVALPLPSTPRILEIGCGTGFLTRALAARGIDGEWTITDLAPAMVARCRESLGEAPNRRFAVLDGEYGEPEGGPFDLVCSSLALQWFDHALPALRRWQRWLAPDGHCMVATLGPGSFGEWRAAHEAEGLEPGTPEFTQAETIAALPGWSVETTLLREHYADAASFLHALKTIGAATARPGHRPLAPAALRRVMTAFDRNGSGVTYEVVTASFVHAS